MSGCFHGSNHHFALGPGLLLLLTTQGLLASAHCVSHPIPGAQAAASYLAGPQEAASPALDLPLRLLLNLVLSQQEVGPMPSWGRAMGWVCSWGFLRAGLRLAPAPHCLGPEALGTSRSSLLGSCTGLVHPLQVTRAVYGIACVVHGSAASRCRGRAACGTCPGIAVQEGSMRAAVWGRMLRPKGPGHTKHTACIRAITENVAASLTCPATFALAYGLPLHDHASPVLPTELATPQLSLHVWQAAEAARRSREALVSQVAECRAKDLGCLGFV